MIDIGVEIFDLLISALKIVDNAILSFSALTLILFKCGFYLFVGDLVDNVELLPGSAFILLMSLFINCYFLFSIGGVDVHG